MNRCYITRTYEIRLEVQICKASRNISFSLPKTIEFFLHSVERSSRLEFESTPSRLFSLRLMFDRSKLESLRDVSVTRIGDAFSYGFPQTALNFMDVVRINDCKELKS